MLFTSLDFVFFFPIVVIAYYWLPFKYRWMLLLGASYYFYMYYNAGYGLLIAFSTLVDYAAAIAMEKAEKKSIKRRYLFASLAGNLGMLFIFKYLNFFHHVFNDIFSPATSNWEEPLIHILLPVGISFYTFQTLSYTIDVYRGYRKAERHLGIFALYVVYFPQLVAGPIEKSTRLLPQFYKKNSFEYDKVVSGFKLILWGYFMKLVVADRAGIYVNAVYGDPDPHSGATFWLATIFFVFQLYCDFGGYSNIAIGCAKVMGYDLMINFRRPLFSRSFGDFWKRWHISLTSWFMFYVYKPLGGGHKGKARGALNLMITFLLSGLWHGANWTFIVWGGLHGAALILERVFAKQRIFIRDQVFGENYRRTYRLLSILVTFPLLLLTAVFFRSDSLTTALNICMHMFWPIGPLFIDSPSVTLYPMMAILGLIMVDYHVERGRSGMLFQSKYEWVRHLSYAAVVILILMVGVFDGGQFIYFQF